MASPAAAASATNGSHAGATLRLDLLGTFQLTCDGAVVPLPRSAQRLLAMLAVSERALPRGVVAGRLWADASERLSHSSLRSALWRLHRTGYVLVDVTAGSLRLADEVLVDTVEMATVARLLLEDRADLDLDVDLTAMSTELLLGWHDDWVVVERERLRQLSLHGLEALAWHLLRRGLHARAIEAALAAVEREPLRESAHRILIQVHLEEGNRSEALRAYQRFADLVREELGIGPSPGLRVLLEFPRATTPTVHDGGPALRLPPLAHRSQPL